MTTRSEFGETMTTIREMIKQVVSVKDAEVYGFEAGYNTPNETNCHFSIFATPELTAAWERGNKQGKKMRKKDEIVRR
jgi:hypothetical protein